MCSLLIFQTAPANFRHVIFNNGAHDSVGGQPTAALSLDFCTIAKASGYKHAVSVSTAEELAAEAKKLKDVTGPVLLEIKINRGARANLGRPRKTPLENKAEFMRFLEG